MERVSRAKAIRLKCIDCCGGQITEVRKCPAENCPLWRYRMGREIKDVNCDDFDDENSD